MKDLAFETQPSIDLELWRKLKQGDKNALALIFKKYYPLLKNYGNSTIQNSDLVKDSIQDIFIDLWIYRNQINEQSPLKPYLLLSLRRRILRNNQKDRVVFNAVDLEEAEYLMDFSIDEKTLKDDEYCHKMNNLNKHISQLSSRQKQVIALRYKEELSILQISKKLKIKNQSVSNLLNRAMIQLKLDLNS